MGALSSSPELCNSFFLLLDDSIYRVEELSGGVSLTADRILNVDEIGFTMNLTAGYILTRTTLVTPIPPLETVEITFPLLQRSPQMGRTCPTLFSLRGREPKWNI